MSNSPLRRGESPLRQAVRGYYQSKYTILIPATTIPAYDEGEDEGGEVIAYTIPTPEGFIQPNGDGIHQSNIGGMHIEVEMDDVPDTTSIAMVAHAPDGTVTLEYWDFSGDEIAVPARQAVVLIGFDTQRVFGTIST